MILSNRMTVYTVHIKVDEPLREQMPIFLKEGFNVIALFLPFLWALYNRLWLVAICIMAFNIIIASIGEMQMLGTASLTALSLSINFYAALAANDWLRARLTRQGYVFADITVADNLLRAQQRYFDRCLAVA